MQRLIVATLAFITVCCCSSGAVFAEGPAGTVLTADDVSAETIQWVQMNSDGDMADPRGPALCPVAGGDVVLCQNQVDNGGGPVTDCNTILIQPIRCAAGGGAGTCDSLTNTPNEYGREWDLATEPGVNGAPFEVRCVRFGIRILAKNYPSASPPCPAPGPIQGLASVPVKVNIYLDADLDGQGNTTPPANADTTLLASKTVVIPTSPFILPNCAAPCPFGVFFNADFSDCAVSIPAGGKLLVGIETPDLTAFGLVGQCSLGCTTLETANCFQRTTDSSCALGNWTDSDNIVANVTNRKTIIQVVGRLNQPVNLGSCCDRSTGICTVIAGPDCIGQFKVYTPCGACIADPDNCPVATGACCNDTTGVCSDGVNIAGCVAPEEHFVEGATCAALDPPCTNSLNNDTCAEAVNIPSLPATIVDNTRFSSFQDTPDCDPEAPGDPDDEVGGVYYTVTGTGGQITVSCCPADGGYADYDQKITVYCGTNCNDLVCVNNPTDGDDACGTGGSASKVVFCSRPAPQKYWILFHGFPNPNTSPEGQGHFKAIITSTGPCSPAPFCVPTGACCLNACGGCSIVPGTGPEGCSSLGGTYIGDGTDCSSCSAPSCCKADMNFDLTRDTGDIPGFVAALLSPPACDSPAGCAADMNSDGFDNGKDVQLFASTIITGGACP